MVMAEIHKFSLSYDTAEDRLAWDAEDHDGGAIRMWLTQRLCQALVKAMVPMIVQSGPPPHGGGTAVQSWEQAAAMAALGKVPPVRPQPQSPAGLVGRVDIKPGPDKKVLTFHFGAEQTCAIGVELPQLRQTLAVIHGLYVAAGWPLDFWPAWIADPAAGSRADVVN